MTERRGTIIFCRILPPRNAPRPHSPDTTILNTVNDAERDGGGGGRYPCRILAPPMPPPPTPQYLTISMTERIEGRRYFS